MRLATPRLTLRPLEPGDARSTFAYAGDPVHTRYMMFLPYASVEETEAYLREAAAQWGEERPAFYEFAILRGGEHIGGVSLYRMEDPATGELGWVLHPAWQGQGFACEAARAVIDWARDSLGLRRIIAQCDSENSASSALMRRLGMRFVSRVPGRRNRAMDGERMEDTWELLL